LTCTAWRLIAGEIKSIAEKGVAVAIVVGGGNFWRGAGKELDRVKADHMGMLATVMNSIALGDILAKNGLPARVLSAVAVGSFAESYRRENALAYLDNGDVLILGRRHRQPLFHHGHDGCTPGLGVESRCGA